MLYPFRKLKNLLYIFQQEEYEILPFLRWVRNARSFEDVEKKQKIRWTLKVKLLFSGVSVLWFLILSVILYYTYLSYFLEKQGFSLDVFQSVLGLVFFIFTVFVFTHWYLVFVNLLLKPFDFLMKKILVVKAKRKLKKHPKLKIVGITGSYGKTSVKEFLYTLLKDKYRVLKTPDNINTPLGVSALIQRENLDQYDVFLVEMGAYRKGDIKEVCDLVSPEMGILTGINESHLERFGKIENTIQTKFELVESLPPKGLALVNNDDENVREHLERFGVVPKKTYSYGLVKDLQMTEKGVRFELKIKDEDLEITAQILGKHNVSNLVGAIFMAQELGMSGGEIQAAVKKVKSVKHRLEPLFNPNGVLVIDDSYNGNPTGVRAAIEVLRQFKEKRKLYITPGLVELGDKKAEVHIEIGERLAKVCDLLILIKNSNLPYFLEGLSQGGWDVEQNNYTKEARLKVFETSEEAHKALGSILQKGDVILFQNDWTDSYS